MKHNEKWYQRRLAKYFTENYESLEDTAEFATDPAPNQWCFYIREVNAIVTLTCCEDGTVTDKTAFIGGETL